MELTIEPKSPTETPPVSDDESTEQYAPRNEKAIEDIFVKETKEAKPKRQLTEKQKEALMKGRAKAKAKREAKYRAEAEEKLKAEPKAKKEKPTSKRDEVLRKIKEKSDAKKREAHEAFESIKWSVLEKQENEQTFIDLENILNSIPEADYGNPEKIVSKLEKYYEHYCSK